MLEASIQELNDNVVKLIAALNSSHENAPKKQAAKPATKKVELKEVPKPTVSRDELRKKLSSINASEVKALIAKHGGTNLSSIPEDHYADFVEEALALAG